jgi:catechol 2,3-dioxygenase-like lactoylglutathione lyase family enzyme
MSASVKLGYTHTRLLVTDYAACFRFYRDLLGLKPHIGDEGGPYAEFRMGNIILALFTDDLMADALKRPYTPCKGECPQGIICMRVDNVDAACEALTQRGAGFITSPTDRPEWGIRTAHLSDPDGNIIELNHPL